MRRYVLLEYLRSVTRPDYVISLLIQSMEITSLKEAWQKYRKRVAVAVFTQTMTTLTGIAVISALYFLSCSHPLLN